MRFFLIIGIFSMLLFSFDLPKSGVKKMNKTLAKLWPDQNITKEAVNFNSKNISFQLQDKTLFKIIINKSTVGYVFLSKGFGKMSEFDYMVVYKPNLKILKVTVLVYRESHGGEIGSTRWLKQFIGKSDPKKMKFGYDIQNISGATLSVRSLTEDLKKVTHKMIELRKKEII